MIFKAYRIFTLLYQLFIRLDDWKKIYIFHSYISDRILTTNFLERINFLDKIEEKSFEDYSKFVYKRQWDIGPKSHGNLKKKKIEINLDDMKNYKTKIYTMAW